MRIFLYVVLLGVSLFVIYEIVADVKNNSYRDNVGIGNQNGHKATNPTQKFNLEYIKTEPSNIAGIGCTQVTNPLEVRNQLGDCLFMICNNGDFVLRGKKIANDKEVAERFMECGGVLKKVQELVN